MGTSCSDNLFQLDECCKLTMLNNVMREYTHDRGKYHINLESVSIVPRKMDQEGVDHSVLNHDNNKILFKACQTFPYGTSLC